MIDFGLSDEEIWGKEPSVEEQQLEKENKKILNRYYKLDDKLDCAVYCLEQIKTILDLAIQTNLRKTNREPNPAIVKSHREALLVFRKIEKELNDYYERTSS